MASRVGLLFAGDLLALLGARAALRALVASGTLGTAIGGDLSAAGPLASPGRPGSTVFAIAVFVAISLTGGYSRQRGLNTAARLAGACALAALTATLPLAAIMGVRAAASQLLVVAAIAWIALVLVRMATEPVLRHLWPRDRGTAPALIIGPDTAPAHRLAAAASAPGGDYRVVARHATTAEGVALEPARLAAVVEESVAAHAAEAIVVCDALDERQLAAVLDVALESGCQLLYPAGAVRAGDTRPRLVWHHDQPFFELGAPVLKASAVTAKRATDLLLAGALLVVSAPLMLLIAVGIRVDSAGSVLFRQDRVGLGGRPFRMLKFRTMHVGSDERKQDLAHLNRTGDARLFKIHGDPRVTRFGAFLRRWSLDELPQLWNVLRGDMSLVGPRPFFEADLAAYEDHHFRRLDTKPGLTGLWQVSGRSDVIDFEDVVFLDRQYIEQWSFWLDVSILFRTIPAVIRRTGAY